MYCKMLVQLTALLSHYHTIFLYKICNIQRKEDGNRFIARFCDGFQGMVRGIFKGSVDLISDHNMSDYIAHIAKAANKRIDPKV